MDISDADIVQNLVAWLSSPSSSRPSSTRVSKEIGSLNASVIEIMGEGYNMLFVLRLFLPFPSQNEWPTSYIFY